MSSAAEREIRDVVVSRLRELVPSARIVHELNCAGQGTNRIDVAAITSDTIIGVEIKSQKDVLKRLTDQLKAFRKCCHVVVVAAHEKHFKEYRDDHWRDDVPGELWLDHPEFFGKHVYSENGVWRYPRPEQGRWGRPTWYFDIAKDTGWKFPLRSSDLLQMLWADELREECARHRIPIRSRADRGTMIRSMALMMTGREVAHAVCRQLRARSFAESDAPIFSEKQEEAA